MWVKERLLWISWLLFLNASLDGKREIDLYMCVYIGVSCLQSALCTCVVGVHLTSVFPADCKLFENKGCTQAQLSSPCVCPGSGTRRSSTHLSRLTDETPSGQTPSCG